MNEQVADNPPPNIRGARRVMNEDVVRGFSLVLYEER